MRTTLTLDDDVAAKLRAEAAVRAVLQAGGQPMLRTGLHSQAVLKALPPFKAEARNMVQRPGLNLNDLWRLIEQIDDPGRR